MRVFVEGVGLLGPGLRGWEAARRVLTGEGLKRRKPGARPGVNGQPARRPSIAMVVGSWIMDPHASPRRRVGAGLVAGVAAAMLLFTTGWLVWYGTHEAPHSRNANRNLGCRSKTPPTSNSMKVHMWPTGRDEA